MSNTLGLSECSASNYWIPHTRAASKFVFGGVFETKTSIRDSSVVGRAILAATTFAGGATTVSVGAWASQLGACRAPRMIVARALTGGTGAYRGVTGQENVKLLVRKKLVALHHDIVNCFCSGTDRILAPSQLDFQSERDWFGSSALQRRRHVYTVRVTRTAVLRLKSTSCAF